MLSGFPPPVCYSFLGCEEHISDSEDTEITEFKNNIVDAKAQAEALNRPMLFDFTGHACVNCRKVEEQIWMKGCSSAYRRRLYSDFFIRR